jgi:flagellar basal-body rod protein FlgG
MALVGRGWFQIETPAGETLYSRAGTFNTNAEGALVNIDGYEIAGGITFPENTSEVTINRSGQIFARIGNDVNLTELGQLTIANFINEAGLEPLGDNLFSIRWCLIRYTR